MALDIFAYIYLKKDKIILLFYCLRLQGLLMKVNYHFIQIFMGSTVGNRAYNTSSNPDSFSSSSNKPTTKIKQNKLATPPPAHHIGAVRCV